MLSIAGQVQKMSPLTRLQVAVKASTGIAYFDCDAPSHVLWHENSKLGELRKFMGFFKNILTGVVMFT